MDFKAYIDSAIKAMPAESRIIKKVYTAMKKAGTPIVKTWDGVEHVEARTLREVQEQAFNLDIVYLMTADGSWVMLVMGNEWDTISDYTTDLEDTLAPVFEYIDQKAN